jgi:hypothetical protein
MFVSNIEAYEVKSVVEKVNVWLEAGALCVYGLLLKENKHTIKMWQICMWLLQQALS